MDVNNPRQPRSENPIRWVCDDEGNVEVIKIPKRPPLVLVAKLDCDLCQNPFVRQKFNAKLQLRDLMEGSERGCQHCRAITEAGLHFLGSHFSDAWEGFTIRIDVETGDTLRLRSILELYTKHLWLGTIQFYITEEPDLNSDLIGVPICVSYNGDTSSQLSVEQVKKWLNICHLDHPECCSPQLESPLPKRTVFLGSNNEDLRLCENTDGDTDNYVCLSHCWGNQVGIKTCQTTTSTISLFYNSIPWDSLPLSFQEAIDFTRRLGFSHIWIDSLCIIQDNEDDWACESSKMAEVYGGCSLTIAAVASKNSSEGLYRYNPPLEIQLDKSLLSVPLFARLDTHDGPLPLLSRGWTFQEELLSKRTVYFTEHELTWKCSNEVTKCQCSAEDRGAFQSRNPTGEFVESCTAEFVPLSLYTPWKRDIVREYSYRELTFPNKDKFPALSGIARFFQDSIREKDDWETEMPQYLAGIWGDDLVEQLLWISKLPTSTNPVYVAPTWSWASINGPIDFRYHSDFHEMYGCITYHYEADILKAVCTPATSDSFGRLSGGHLEISTAVFPAQVFPDPEKTRCFAYRSQGDIGIIEKGIEFESVFLDSEIALDKGSDPQYVLCAVVKVRSTVIWCLLLEAIDNNRCAFPFRRIGLAEDTTTDVDSPKTGQFWVQSFIPDIMEMSRSVIKII